jgi:hypothetical protein
MSPFAKFAVLVLIAVALTPSASARIFTDIEGKTIEADLISMIQDQVTFRREVDNKVFTLLLSQFSVKDRNFILNEKQAGRLSMTDYSGLLQNPVEPVKKDVLHHNASQRIDQILAKYWQEQGVAPAPISNDATYLRRAYLKIIGRIPTYAEAVHFLNNETPDKREALVDKLLDSPGYVSHNFNLWADVLRAKTTGKEGARYGGIHYVPWIKDQIRRNVAYDVFVESLLTAEGYPWDNPATAYYLRDFGMPLDNMSMTAQIFLGTQLQCAQCHDHPTDVWTQKDFYELSAFTYGIKTGVNIQNEIPELKAVFQQLKQRARAQNKGKTPSYQTPSPLSAGREFFDPLRWGVIHTNRDLKLPDDYQYDDAQPKDVVKPKLLYGEHEETELHNSTARVESYADWLVSANNKRFTLVIANRMWKQAMGKGLIEPIDNLTEESVADSPELMTFLETLMRNVDYDLKQYQRIIYNTQYFQRQSRIDNPDLPDDYHMEGPVFQRMTSEQIWDSIATLMTPDIDLILEPGYKGNERGIRYESGQKPAAALYLEEWTTSTLVTHIDKLTDAYKTFVDARSEWNQIRNEPALRNTPRLAKVKADFNAARKAWNQILNPDTGTEDIPQMGMMAMMPNVPKTGKGRNNRADEKWIKGIRRASELQSPQTNGHLLEVFGQSDRELIQNADDGGNVLQALFLMNSPQTNYLLANLSAPVMEARLAKTPADKLETLYIGFLARKPTEAEKEALLPSLEKEPEKARQRIIWAMLNTQQFLFIQ